MKHTGIILMIVALFAGCQHEKTQLQDRSASAPQSGWKQGDVVELTGKIHPSRTDAKYFIQTDDGRGASVRSDAIDKLDAGTKLWVKGKIEYIHHPKPKDYREEKTGQDKLRVSHGVAFPQTICYINVSEYRILTLQPPERDSVPTAR